VRLLMDGKLFWVAKLLSLVLVQQLKDDESGEVRERKAEK
jgi:hypothetical protein